MRQYLILVVLLSLLSAPVCAVGPFTVSCQPAGENLWEFTLCNNGDSEMNPWAWYLDLNWINDFSTIQTPQQEFVVMAAPTDWIPNNGLPYPAFDTVAFEAEPAVGNCLSGFQVSAASPALWFRVTYEDDVGYWEQIGEVEYMPEPGSMLALICGLAGAAGLAARRRK